MSNEWAHVAARKGVPTEMTNLSHDGRVLTTLGLVVADPGGTCPRGAVPAQLVPDRSVITAARAIACTEEKSAQRATLQKYPFMTRGAVISGGASSGPHRAWDPV
jgi:hypothetical protein